MATEIRPCNRLRSSSARLAELFDNPFKVAANRTFSIYDQMLYGWNGGDIGASYSDPFLVVSCYGQMWDPFLDDTAMLDVVGASFPTIEFTKGFDTNYYSAARAALAARAACAARAARKEKEPKTRRSTLNQIEFDKTIRKLLKNRHSIHKEANKPLSTPLGNTVQQMHTAPAPRVPCDDGNRVPPSAQMPMALPSNNPASVGASIDADPNHVENPGDEPSSSKEASHAHALDITSSSNGACDDGNRAPPSTQMPMAFPSNHPASVGASIDDDPNHIGNLGDEPSSSTEASPAHAPDIASSSNGACDDGNRDPPSTQMPMALPGNDPISVGALIDDDPNHIRNSSDEPSSSTEVSPAQAPDMTSSSNGAPDFENPVGEPSSSTEALPTQAALVGASIDDDPNHIGKPGDEPSSSTEASTAQAPDITSSSNGACDDGNRAPPSTQMPMALPSNDPVSVGASIDDDPNHIGNPGDEPSSTTEASPAQAPDITSSSNGAPDFEDPVDEPSSSTDASPAQAPDFTPPSSGASPPVREDGSERSRPPPSGPPPPGNRDLEASVNCVGPNDGVLLFAVQVTQVLFSMGSKGIGSSSHIAEILQYFAHIGTFIGFLSGVVGILLSNRRNPGAAPRFMFAIAYVATGLGFIAAMCASLFK